MNVNDTGQFSEHCMCEMRSQHQSLIFWLTFIAEEIRPGAPGSVVADEGCIGAVGGVNTVREAADALLS